MNSSQIASLVECGIPLLIGLLLLIRPSLFVSKSLDAASYFSVKNRLAKGGVLLLIAAGLIFVANAGRIISPEKESTEAFLEAVVSHSNQLLPKRIDEITTLERVSTAENAFLYHYQLHNLDLDGLSTDEASAILKPELIKQLRNNKGVEEFKARGIHVHHIYSATDGSIALTIKIAPSEF